MGNKSSHWCTDSLDERGPTAERLMRVARSVAWFGIWEWDVIADVTICSAVQRTLFGLEPSQHMPTGDAFLQLIHPEDREQLAQTLMSALESGFYDAEFRVVWPDGSVHWLLGRGEAIRDANGRVTGLSGINIDNTDRKRAEEQGRHAVAVAEEATAMKSRFLANMSHEIRTPMNGILGLAEMVFEERDDEKRQRYLQLLKNSAEGLMVVLNDVLDLSKIEAHHMRIERIPFALADCVQKAADTLLAPAQSKGLNVSWNISSDLPPTVIGDPVRVRQILLNLIGNAIKFTTQGYVHVSATLAGESVRFTIEDTGIGITPEQMEKIFQPFEQADISTTRTFGGTGLGLSIVAELVKLMNGKIWVESRVGMGTTFHVEIHLPPVAAVVSVSVAAPVPMDCRSLRILVAEDHPINQMVTAALLEKRGHQVRVVADGCAALTALERDQFDLVLMDVQMPVMDGLQATVAIRAKEGTDGKHLPVIALTAHAMGGDQETLLAAGMDAYVPKPVRAEQLFETIARVLLLSHQPGAPTDLSAGHRTRCPRV